MSSRIGWVYSETLSQKRKKRRNEMERKETKKEKQREICFLKGLTKIKVLQRVIIDGMELLFGTMKCSGNGNDG